MRILHVMASAACGGAETYSTDVMLTLHQQGVDQCVVMPERAPRFYELKKAGLRLIPAPFKIPFKPLQKTLTRLVIAKEQPDIVQTWMRRGAYLAGKRQKESVVLGWFGGYYNPEKFKNCAHLVGVTKGIVDHMIDKGVPQARAHYIPTFPDITPDAPIDRNSLTTPQDAKVLLTLSRLHPKKGLDTFLRALKELPDCVAWMAGDGPLRQELETQAENLGLRERVRFLGWRTDRSALLRAANVCVLPSRYEPFGTVILEAWATQVPLVACASAGPAAHIDNDVNGLVVPVDDAPALAAALRRVLDDADLRRRLIVSGLKTFTAAYTREAVTRQWLDFYQSIMNERRAWKGGQT